jgi:hypothetical protein
MMMLQSGMGMRLTTYYRCAAAGAAVTQAQLQLLPGQLHG